MKISKEVWIDKHIKWNILKRREIYKHNCYKGHAYLVCTSPHEHLLFAIIEASVLNEWYAQETLLAVCENKQQAITQVKMLVDALYNQKTLTYTQL